MGQSPARVMRRIRVARALWGASPARYAGNRRGNCGRIGFWKLNNSESITSLSVVTTNTHGDAGQRQHIRARSSAPSSSDTGKEGLEERASESRKIHTSGTDLIAALLEAEHEAAKSKGSSEDAGGTGTSGARALAVSRVDELTPEFFSVADAYMALARKEGNADVIAQLESILKIAWEVKNDTLRGELKLLNQLINAKKASERASLLRKNAAFLHSDDGFFFKTLEQFTTDVEKKPEVRPGSGDRMKMMVKLRTIKKEAKRAASDSESLDLV